MKGFFVIALVGLTATLCTAAPDCSKSNDGDFLPNEKDCEHFYVCKDHNAILRKCQTDLHFSPKYLYCLPPKSAGCDSNPGPGPGPGPDPTPSPGPKPDPKSCKRQILGKNIPHPSDCKQYITCIGGGVLRQCPPNTHFNAVKEVCDWPERAGCE